MDFSEFQISNYLLIFFVFAAFETLIRLLPRMQKNLERAPGR